MKTTVQLLVAAVGLGCFSAAPAADADSMFECAAFYDAAAAAVRERPELSKTRFLVGNPGRASLLLFSSGAQMSGVQAGWNKYSVMQRTMLSLLAQDTTQVARVVSKYDAQCMAIVSEVAKTPT